MSRRASHSAESFIIAVPESPEPYADILRSAALKSAWVFLFFGMLFGVTAIILSSKYNGISNTESTFLQWFAMVTVVLASAIPTIIGLAKQSRKSYAKDMAEWELSLKHGINMNFSGRQGAAALSEDSAQVVNEDFFGHCWDTTKSHEPLTNSYVLIDTPEGRKSFDIEWSSGFDAILFTETPLVEVSPGRPAVVSRVFNDVLEDHLLIA